MNGFLETKPTKRCAVVLLALLLPATALAQAGRVTLEVDRHIAQVGEPMQVTVTIVVTGQAGYERYLPPTFEGFQVSAGGMTTQNIEIINWQVRRREGHTYTVTPVRAGALTVGPAAIIVRGRRVSSAKVTIQVRGGTAAPPPPASSEPDAGAVPGFPEHRAHEPVFLAAVASARKVYLGQQVVVTWYLFTQSDVLGFHSTKQPTTDNFWTEDLRSPRRLVFDRRMLGNRLFHAAVIAKKALFPQQTGTLTIGPLGARVRTLEHFSSAAATKESEPITVEVKPLPEQGKPAGFVEENVGQFDFAASLDRARVKAGEGVTLKLVVHGSGNLRQVKPPALDSLDGFRVYKPKVDERLSLEEGVTGEKIFEYLLLPERAGRLEIPALHLDFFDPESEAYRSASTEPLTLEVTGTMPAAGPGAPAAKNVIGPTIRPPRPAGHLEHEGAARGVHRSPVFLALLLLPVVGLLGWTGGERLRARLRQETPGSLRRAAGRRTRRHLARAQELRRARDVRGFYAEIAASLRALLDHRLHLPIEGMTRPELAQRMGRAGFSDEIVGEVLGQLDRCDAARFAPGTAGEPDEMEQTLTRVRRLLDRVGRVSVKEGGG